MDETHIRSLVSRYARLGTLQASERAIKRKTTKKEHTMQAETDIKLILNQHDKLLEMLKRIESAPFSGKSKDKRINIYENIPWLELSELITKSQNNASLGNWHLYHKTKQ